MWVCGRRRGIYEELGGCRKEAMYDNARIREGARLCKALETTLKISDLILKWKISKGFI